MAAGTMRGVVFLGDRVAEVREFPIPTPGPGQVLVQMKRAAICGSDLHTYRRPRSFFAGKDPWIPGHETSGSRAVHQAVIDVLRRNGRGVFVGFGSQEPSVNLTAIIGKQLVLMGSFVMPIHYYQDLVDFMLEHNLPAGFQRMITHRFPITQSAEAFGVADEGKSGKIMFVWE